MIATAPDATRLPVVPLFDPGTAGGLKTLAALQLSLAKKQTQSTFFSESGAWLIIAHRSCRGPKNDSYGPIRYLFQEMPQAPTAMLGILGTVRALTTAGVRLVLHPVNEWVCAYLFMDHANRLLDVVGLEHGTGVLPLDRHMPSRLALAASGLPTEFRERIAMKEKQRETLL
jgi:hypothetical protein